MAEKLVRDLIPQILSSQGRRFLVRQANKNEIRHLLKEKLLEEVHEFMVDESIEEIADVLEVIEAIAVAYGFKQEEILKVKQNKKDSRGAFEQGMVLELNK